MDDTTKDFTQDLAETAEEVPSAEPEPKRERRRRQIPSVAPLLARWGTWIAIVAIFAFHLRMVIRNIQEGVHEWLPPYTGVEAGSLEAWIEAIPRLFFKPDTIHQTLQMYALWIFFFVFLCIYGAVRVGDSIPRGVLMLLSSGLAVIMLLLVLIPASWVLFGDNGPVAVELVPPFVLGGMALLLEFSSRRMMDEG